MNVYRIIADSDEYEHIYADENDRDVLYFNKCHSLIKDWKPRFILPDERLTDNSMNERTPKKGDFPSLYRPTPVFSQRAWDILSPLIATFVEPLPLIHPSGEIYFAINVLELVDCLNLTQSKVTRNDASGRISKIHLYRFKRQLLEDKHIFKLPETMGLEVLVSQEFKDLVTVNCLDGLIFEMIASYA